MDDLKIPISGGAEQLLGQRYFLMGDTFIRSFYTIFDQEENRIGFGSKNKLEPATPRPPRSYYGIQHYVTFGIGYFIVFLTGIISFYDWKTPEVVRSSYLQNNNKNVRQQLNIQDGDKYTRI